MTVSTSGSCLELAQAAGLLVTGLPETNQEADLADDLLTQAMNNLTIDEHEKLIFDIHGVVCENDDETTLDLQLKEFETELLSNEKENDAYLQAKKWNNDYVSDRNFRRLFLRHSNMDVKAAAKLFLQHFQEKQNLFGSGEVLGRDVRQSDLNPMNLAVLESGFVQLLPSRDAAGRALLFFSTHPVGDCPKGSHQHHNNAVSMYRKTTLFPLFAPRVLSSYEFPPMCQYRSIWYLVMKALQDEETQKRGIIWIVRNFNGRKATQEHLHGTRNVLSAIPHSNIGGHFCYADPELRPYATGFHLFSGIRTKRHFGTREQIDFELQTFGIPTQDFPDRIDGCFSTKEHLERLVVLKAQEEAMVNANESPKDCIIVPRRFDVLFGRSQMAREHTGTRRALHIVEMYFETYETLSRLRKTEVAERIISIIHESGGRFLRQEENGTWVYADDIEARKKIAHWFRHMRRKSVPLESEPRDEPGVSKSRTKRVIPRDSQVDDSADECIKADECPEHCSKKLNLEEALSSE